MNHVSTEELIDLVLQPEPATSPDARALALLEEFENKTAFLTAPNRQLLGVVRRDTRTYWLVDGGSIRVSFTARMIVDAHVDGDLLYLTM